MNLHEFYNYKNELMKDICSNPTIVKLLTENNNPDVPNHVLPYTQVYPYEFVPETVSEARSFICFDVDIMKAPNKTYYYPVLYIWPFTHKSKFRTKDGKVLIDELSSVLDDMLNGSRYFGLGDLKLHSVQRFVPIADYLGRVLTYYATDFNRPTINTRSVPSVRKT